MKNFIFSLFVVLAFASICCAAPGALQQFPQAKIWNSTDTTKLETFAIASTSGTKVIGYIIVEATGSENCEIGIFKSSAPFGTVGAFSEFITTITVTSQRDTWYGIQSSTHGFSINHRGTRAGKVKFLWDYLSSQTAPQ